MPEIKVSAQRSTARERTGLLHASRATEGCCAPRAARRHVLVAASSAGSPTGRSSSAVVSPGRQCQQA